MSDTQELPPLPTLPLGRYRHYKGGEYEALGMARHSESHEPQVVYRPLYNTTGWWVRPYAMFVEEAVFEGRHQPRFVKVADAPKAAEATALTETLQALEAELHHPGVRCSPERLDALLHPDFHEVGRSGARYTRETVLTFLAGQTPSPDVLAWAYAARPLGPDTALLTYQSAHRSQADAGAAKLTNLSHRSSIWVRSLQGWQLLYHQGTPTTEGT